LEVGDDGFLEKLRRRRRNLGLLMVEEYCGVLGDAVAAARRRRRRRRRVMMMSWVWLKVEDEVGF